MNSTRITWKFHTTSSLDAPELADSLGYIHEMRSSWRPPASTDSNGPLVVPQSWFDDPLTDFSLSNINMAYLNVHLSPIRDYLRPAKPHAVDDRTSQDEPELDFGRRHATKVLNVMDYKPLPGLPDPSLIDRIAGMFVGIESCWTKLDPKFRFPSSFPEIPDDSSIIESSDKHVPDGSISFAVAHQYVHPKRRSTCVRARTSPVGPLSPALLLGIIDHSDAPSPDLSRMATGAEPNLQAVLMEYSLQHRKDHVLRPLPPWMIVFGVYFHSDSVSLIAHIPRAEFFYSILVDILPYPPRISSSSDIISRLRLAVALLAVRDHVVRLNGLFSSDTVAEWPTVLRDYETDIVREMTGVYTPNPSESTDEDGNALYLEEYGETSPENSDAEISPDNGDAEATPDNIIASRPAQKRSKEIVTEWLERSDS